MSSYPVFAAFKSRLESQWTTTPLVFENEHYELPDTPAAFVFVEIYGDTLQQESLGSPGSNRWLESGVTYLHVMTPSGGGTESARQNADSLMALFREVPLTTSNGTVFIQEMSPGAGDPGKDFANYWSFCVTLHWHVRTTTGA